MDMWDLADELGLTVIEQHGEHTSGYKPSENHVRLTPGMRGRVLRSVLAHEIAHHALGHLPVPPGAERDRQEAAANRWAALRLITPEAYAAAERARDGYAPAIAVDLQVADELVDVYQQHLARIGDTVYVAPKMGLGQYQHRQLAA